MEQTLMIFIEAHSELKCNFQALARTDLFSKSQSISLSIEQQNAIHSAIIFPFQQDPQNLAC